MFTSKRTRTANLSQQMTIAFWNCLLINPINFLRVIFWFFTTDQIISIRFRFFLSRQRLNAACRRKITG
ncbi:hypothetical protein L1987_84232 [Smallanthus sonchifolius]|uniref:Uncharacterized protein n=1 Tax=Smallanthus sonchifolius TaxID=185202 RepID=A0ACB8YES7_9ASTR|nr:hypothetical protein L1987_84232 [Smallanthus sonchifolius]